MKEKGIATAVIAVVIVVILVVAGLGVYFLIKTPEGRVPGAPITGDNMIRDGRFGGGGMPSTDFAAMQDLGVHWKRLSVGVDREIATSARPWEEYEKIIWMENQIIQMQSYGVLGYVIINPRSQKGVWPTAQEFANTVKKLVERYDNDGENDMPGLIYPIKVYEICNEVLLLGYPPPIGDDWHGFTYEMYLEYLQKSYQALKEADPDAQLACGAVVGPGNLTFDYVIDHGGSNYFDIFSYHAYEEYLQVDDLISYLENKGIGPSSANPKPIWLTESQFTGMLEEPPLDITQEEAARRMVRSYVYAFAKGFTKLTPSELTEMPSWPEDSGLAWSTLIDRNGNKRPSYYAYRTLAAKLDYFTSVQELAQYQYKFIVDNKPVYVLWGTGSLPSEITGTVKMTDISGNEQEKQASQITLGDNPIFIEPVG